MVVVVEEDERMAEQREAVTTLLSCGTLRGAHASQARERVARLPALILGESPGEPLEVNSRSCRYCKYLLISNNVCRSYGAFLGADCSDYTKQYHIHPSTNAQTAYISSCTYPMATNIIRSFETLFSLLAVDRRRSGLRVWAQEPWTLRVGQRALLPASMLLRQSNHQRSYRCHICPSTSTFIDHVFVTQEP
jgi:hypothetical protein